MAPGLLWLTALMVVPCLLVFVLMFYERGTYGGIDWTAATLENFTRAVDPLYLSIFLDSARIAWLPRPLHCSSAIPPPMPSCRRRSAGRRRCCFSPSCRSGPII